MKVTSAEQTEWKVVSAKYCILHRYPFPPPSKSPPKMHEGSFGFGYTDYKITETPKTPKDKNKQYIAKKIIRSFTFTYCLTFDACDGSDTDHV